MDLFNKRIINEYIEKNIYAISDKGLLHLEIIERIKNFLKQDADRTKEKSIQTLFLQRVFEEILGYPSQLSGEKKYNLLIEPTTDFDSTEPDGALGFFDLNLKKVRAVIELKSSNIDLDKKQLNRKDNKSPVEQAFSYSYKFDGCKWVIVSNFKDIRLYNTERGINFYQKFNVLDLHDENKFRKFYFIFNKDNLLSMTEESLIEKLTKETNLKEENITKEFYSKYKETRNRLYKQLTEDNAQIDKNIILEKTQKIIDRVIFISFCEDLGLLPYNILRNILKITDDSYDLTEYKLWNQLKGLFYSINIGNPNKNINKFNGGLFTDDNLLNDLNIKDDILKELIKISDYDFESELNVNILGHIFEQSISDIEEMKADINEIEAGKKEGKRKKEGIYYTPEYVTKYIVEQAIGGWLEDRKKELGFNTLPELSEEDYKSIKITKGKLKANIKVEVHINFWKSYREILQNIKVLDPSCGSGAFLIQSFDYLYKEGQLVNDELAKLKKGQRQIFDLDKHILTNNIYGVDLNEESVEITKLSLWLKTANKAKELTALDENIKCGNSLIDEFEIVGEKAFKWEDKFKNIIKENGFDIIIGNPPWGAKFSESEKRFLKNNYNYSTPGKIDSYKYFYERTFTLLKSKGYISFITPNTFLYNIQSKSFREKILEDFIILEAIELRKNIFSDAPDTVPAILILNKNHIKDVENRKLITIKVAFPDKKLISLENNKWMIEQSLRQDIFMESDDKKINLRINKNLISIINKINLNDNLEKYFSLRQGTKPYGKKDIKTETLIRKNYPKEGWTKAINGRNIGRYCINYENDYVYEFGNLYSVIPKDILKSNKIYFQRMRKISLFPRIIACYDDGEYHGLYTCSVIYPKNNNKRISLKYLLGILNSKLINIWYKNFDTDIEIKLISVGKIPIAINDDKQEVI